MAFRDALQGGIGGATLGGGIGGPVGAAIGGGAGLIAGGLSGLFGQEDMEGQKQKDMLIALANEAQNRGNPQQSAYSDFRGDQRDYLSRLKNISEGGGPSLANETMRQGITQNTVNQAAMAAGARGSGALAARQGMNNAAGAAGQAIGSGQMARAQEQMGAMQQLGLGIYGARGQDEANNQFNSNLLLRALGQNDQTRLGALGQSLNASQLVAGQGTNADLMQAGMSGLGQTFTQARAGKQANLMALSQLTPEQRAYYEANA